MTQGRYRISFTSGSLYHRESVKLAELYLSLRDWEEVRAQTLRSNLLQARTESTAKRTCREAIARLKTLTESELTFLAEANHQDQAHFCGLPCAACTALSRTLRWKCCTNGLSR